MWMHDFWGHDLWGQWTHKSYRPLTVLGLRLTHDAFGRAPWAFHAGNIALHVAACVALFLWVRREVAAAPGAPAVAAAAAAVFAVHPVNSEVVANVASRAESLGALFAFLAANSHSRALVYTTVRWRYMCLTILLAIASLLSKEVGGMVLPALAAFDAVELLWRRRGEPAETDADGAGSRDTTPSHSLPRPPRLQVAVRMIASAASGAVLLALRHALTGGTSIAFPRQFNPLVALEPAQRLATLPYVWSQAVMLLLWPAGLSFDHSALELPEEPLGLANLAPVLAVVVTAVLLCALLALDAETPHARLAVKSFLLGGLAYLPASNLLFSVGFVIAERALYLPCAAACVTLACVFASGALRAPRASGTALALLLMTAGVRTCLRCEAWESEMKLFNAALDVYPRCGLAAYGRGYLRFGAGDYTAAAADFAVAIDVDVQDKKAHWMAGRSSYMLGDLEGAERWLRNAVVIDEKFWAHGDLGLVLWQTGRRAEGAEHMQRALDALMHDFDSHRITHLNNAACSRLLMSVNASTANEVRSRAVEEAQAMYERAIRAGVTSGKNVALQRYNLAHTYAVQDRPELALHTADSLEAQGTHSRATIEALVEKRKAGEPIGLDCVLEFAT